MLWTLNETSNSSYALVQNIPCLMSQIFYAWALDVKIANIFCGIFTLTTQAFLHEKSVQSISPSQYGLIGHQRHNNGPEALAYLVILNFLIWNQQRDPFLSSCHTQKELLSTKRSTWKWPMKDDRWHVHALHCWHLMQVLREV